MLRGVRSRTERRLRRLSTKLAAAREDLRITEEQLVVLAEMEDDARIRSIVSESPMDVHDHVELSGDLSSLSRRRSQLIDEIGELERRQDELLDQMFPD